MKCRKRRIELGAEMTNTIARRTVVPPQRDGGQAQFIAKPLPESSSLSLAPVAEWMLENLTLDLSVDQLDNRRLVEHALHPDRLGAIAAECGFGSAAVLRQNFGRMLGLTPTAYRARFTCTAPAA